MSKLIAAPVRPMKRGPGRPRVRGALPFSHYGGSRTGKRPVCRAVGCSEYLKRGQIVSCSEECLKKIEVAAAILLEGVQHDRKTNAIAEVTSRSL